MGVNCRAVSPAAHWLVTTPEITPGCIDDLLPLFAGLQPSGPSGRAQCQRLPAAMVRTHSRACSLSVMAGNRRRSSTAAENSPPWSKAVQIAAASASVTTNITRAWEGRSASAS